MSYKRLTDKKTLKTMRNEMNLDNPYYIRLADLEDKIENGTLVELPFLVGQDVFIIENNEIVMGVVNGIWWQDEFLIEVRYNKGKYAQRLKNEIFLTKAEAEAKLQGE